MQLETGDTLLIPFTQRLVTVSGGVVRPGVFAYVPDKTVNYYLSLAGGLSDDAAYPTDIKIQGPDGKTLALEENIPPETTIAVAKETLARDIAPTVAIIGLVSSILGIIATVVNIILDSKSL
jgi:protein involved in polysaccharide export with SLBB domain